MPCPIGVTFADFKGNEPGVDVTNSEAKIFATLKEIGFDACAYQITCRILCTFKSGDSINACINAIWVNAAENLFFLITFKPITAVLNILRKFCPSIHFIEWTAALVGRSNSPR